MQKSLERHFNISAVKNSPLGSQEPLPLFRSTSQLNQPPEWIQMQDFLALQTFVSRWQCWYYSTRMDAGLFCGSKTRCSAVWLNHRWMCVDLAILGSLQKGVFCREGKSLLQVALRNSEKTENKEDTKLWNQNFNKVGFLTWSNEILTFKRNKIKNSPDWITVCFFFLHLLGLRWQILELHLPVAQFYWSAIEISLFRSELVLFLFFFPMVLLRLV